MHALNGFLLHDIGDKKGLCTRKCVEELELEIRGWFIDEWSLLCSVWEKRSKKSQGRNHSKAWESRIESHSLCRSSKMWSKQVVLNQIKSFVCGCNINKSCTYQTRSECFRGFLIPFPRFVLPFPLDYMIWGIWGKENSRTKMYSHCL